jgi:hypothetical protein
MKLKNRPNEWNNAGMVQSCEYCNLPDAGRNSTLENTLPQRKACHPTLVQLHQGKQIRDDHVNMLERSPVTNL